MMVAKTNTTGAHTRFESVKEPDGEGIREEGAALIDWSPFVLYFIPGKDGEGRREWSYTGKRLNIAEVE